MENLSFKISKTIGWPFSIAMYLKFAESPCKNHHILTTVHGQKDGCNRCVTRLIRSSSVPFQHYHWGVAANDFFYPSVDGVKSPVKSHRWSSLFTSQQLTINCSRFLVIFLDDFHGDYIVHGSHSFWD